MGKDKRATELRNQASREMAKTFTTIRKLSERDALDVLQELLRRATDRARELLFADHLVSLLEHAETDIAARNETALCAPLISTGIGSTSRENIHTNSASCPPPPSHAASIAE